MSDKPFALLVARPPSTLADSEYEAYLEFGNLKPEELVAIQLSEIDPEDINIDDYRGFIGSGSPFSYNYPEDVRTPEHRQTEYALEHILRRLIDADLPFLGVCYGHQAIANCRGDALTQDTPDPLSIIEITLTPEALADPLFKDFPPSFYSIVGHEDSIESAPADGVILAYSDNCPVQAVRVKNNIYGVQFHPEITMETLQLRLDMYVGRYFPAERAPEIIAVGEANDMVQVSRVVTNFVDMYRNV
ncbi:MAG: C26 family cysteine hydrolase domain-containing family [Actinomycetaceae bacterium]|nr:C26 family cysteine hydrolase domain-containing family [Actinomycetaceae bacterium]